MIIKTRMTTKRFYDENGDELSGYCYMPTPTRMSIQVSRHFNKTINQYAGTMLHELLHAWVNLLQAKGFKAHPDPEIAEEIEEQFAAEVERVVIRKFKRRFPRRK